MLIMKGLIVSQEQSILPFHSVRYRLPHSNKNDMVGLNRLVLKKNLSYFLILFYIFPCSCTCLSSYYSHHQLLSLLLLSTHICLWERLFDLILIFVGATESKHGSDHCVQLEPSVKKEKKNMSLLEEARKGEKIRSQNEFCTHLMLYSIFCYSHLLWQCNTV